MQTAYALFAKTQRGRSYIALFLRIFRWPKRVEGFKSGGGEKELWDIFREGIDSEFLFLLWGKGLSYLTTIIHEDCKATINILN